MYTQMKVHECLKQEMDTMSENGLGIKTILMMICYPAYDKNTCTAGQMF